MRIIRFRVLTYIALPKPSSCLFFTCQVNALSPYSRYRHFSASEYPASELTRIPWVVARSSGSSSEAMTETNLPSREELRRLRLAAFERGNEKEEPETKRLKTQAQNAQVVDLMASSDEEDEEPIVTQPTGSRSRAKKEFERKKSTHPKKNEVPLSDREVVDLWESSEDEKDEPKRSSKARATKSVATSKSLTQNDSSSAEPASQKTSFQVASYNLWFGPQRNGSPHAQARMEAVADVLLARSDPPLYFMAFQEVVHTLDDALFPLIQSSDYRIIRQPLDNPMFLPYGVALAVHQSLQYLDGGWKPYRMTQMDRGFVYARCRLPNGLVCLATSTHLESWTGKESTGSTARQQQLNAMENFCNHHIEERTADIAIMMGDLNWDDTSRNPTDPVLDEVLSSVEWKDAWMSTNHLRSTADAKKGYTYDAKLNPMLGGNLRRRFDRCLVRHARHIQTNLVSTTLVGTEALPGLTFEKENPYTNNVRHVPTVPSDHFGLVSEIQTFAKGKTQK